jgi:predicted nucleic acid-binding protein
MTTGGIMPLKIDRTEREQIVSNQGPLSVCIYVENGKAKQAEIHGLYHESIYVGDATLLELLWRALTEARPEVLEAEDRTKLPSEDDV